LNYKTNKIFRLCFFIGSDTLFETVSEKLSVILLFIAIEPIISIFALLHTLNSKYVT